MQWTKVIRLRYLLLLFALAFVITRFAGLGPDAINPDGVNWHYRSQQFVVALKTGDLAKTYQHYHPGVTLMWIMGIPIELVKQLDSANQFYTHENFMLFHVVAKYSVVGVQLFLTFAVIFALHKVFALRDKPFPGLAAIIAVAIFTFEPFFVGNSRLLHMDVLLALLMFLGLLFFYLYLAGKNYVYGILAGVVLALAFLTKSIAVGNLLFALVFGAVWLYREIGTKATLKYLGVFLASYVVAMFIFFPALWVAPFETIYNIFDEAERVGIRKGHGQIILGEYTRDAGPGFYFLVMFLKVSPFALLGIAAYFVSRVKNVPLGIMPALRKVKYSPELFLGIFYLGYLLVMIYPSKKLDRYMIPMYPFIGMLAVWGYYALLQKLSRRTLSVLAGLLVIVFVAYPIIKLHPYPFTYTTPFAGSPGSANRILAQKPFGIGIPALKEYIFDKYGEYPTLGFIDTKPMSAIYMNSRLFDVRVDGTDNYDLLILALNEEIPEDVLESKNKYTYDSSFYINGLEYWRIYVKEK